MGRPLVKLEITVTQTLETLIDKCTIKFDLKKMYFILFCLNLIKSHHKVKHNNKLHTKRFMNDILTINLVIQINLSVKFLKKNVIIKYIHDTLRIT